MAATAKGVPDAVQAEVKKLLNENPGQSAAELAEGLGVSRVTARRYLESMADAGMLERRPRYSSAGRPVLEYHLSVARDAGWVSAPPRRRSWHSAAMDIAESPVEDGSMSKKSRVWLAVSLVIVLLAGAGVFALFRLPMTKSSAAEAAAHDLAEEQLSSDIWHEKDLVQGLFDRVTKSLGKRVDLRSVTVDDITEADGRTVATLDWTWANNDGESWEYSSQLPLEKSGLFWWADLTEKAIHPKLGKGGSFALRANPGGRGKILGADDEVLMEDGKVIDISIHPNGSNPTPSASSSRGSMTASTPSTSTPMTSRSRSMTPRTISSSPS